MTPVARALATPTGDPVLKLILLCVAGSPGWPAAEDVAAAAEVPGPVAVDALAELVRRRAVVVQPSAGTPRYGLAEDGWEFTRPDTGTPAEAPTEESLALLATGDIGGYPMGARISARVQP